MGFIQWMADDEHYGWVQRDRNTTAEHEDLVGGKRLELPEEAQDEFGDCAGKEN
jgi:hypothetical protein